MYANVKSLHNTSEISIIVHQLYFSFLKNKVCNQVKAHIATIVLFKLINADFVFWNRFIFTEELYTIPMHLLPAWPQT